MISSGSHEFWKKPKRLVLSPFRLRARSRSHRKSSTTRHRFLPVRWAGLLLRAPRRGRNAAKLVQSLIEQEEMVFMPSWFSFISFVGVYIVLMRWVLPRLGVPT